MLTAYLRWAWQNPHITTRIPTDSRISISTQKKLSGQPKRPRLTLTSGLSNLHLLLRVPSFARWPLEVRFFTEDAHKAWQKWLQESPSALPESTLVVKDFPPQTGSAIEEEPTSPSSKRRKLGHGIDALLVDYASQKTHVEKAKSIVDFEQEGSCSLCNIELEHDAGIYTICPSPECDSVTHLTCLSQHFLQNDDDKDALVPMLGSCPKCKTELRWVDIVKELSLRMRGQKEVEKLLKVRKLRKTKGITASQAIVDDSEDSDEDLEKQVEAELRELRRLNPELGDSYLDFEASDDSDTGSIASSTSRKQAASTSHRLSYQSEQGKRALDTVIEDSDWDEAEVLD